jgi:hypothetical protein
MAHSFHGQIDMTPARRRTWWILAALLVVVFVGAGVAVWATDDDGDSASRPGSSSTRPVTTTTNTLPAAATSTTAPVTTKPGQGPLDTFQLGYDGLGLIKLGMTLAEASTAAGAPIALVQSNCGLPDATAMVTDYYRAEGEQLWFGVQDGRIVNVSTKNPVFSTISGVHVGDPRDDVFRKYPTAVGSADSPTGEIRVTNSEGRVVAFYAPTESGRVGYIRVARDQSFLQYGGC